MESRIKWKLLSFIFLSLGMISTVAAQNTAGYTQQLFAISKMMPAAKSIGIISNKVTESFIQSTTRAGYSFGIKVIIAKASSPREIPDLYHTLLKDGVKMIWLPDKDDAMLLEKGFEYLRESTLEDKIGLCVPVSKMVPEGALCCIQSDGNKLIVSVNKRVAQVVNVTVPDDPNGSIKYILK